MEKFKEKKWWRKGNLQKTVDMLGTTGWLTIFPNQQKKCGWC